MAHDVNIGLKYYVDAEGGRVHVLHISLIVHETRVAGEHCQLFLQPAAPSNVHW